MALPKDVVKASVFEAVVAVDVIIKLEYLRPTFPLAAVVVVGTCFAAGF